MLSAQLKEIICQYVPPSDRAACDRRVEVALQKERSLLLAALQARLWQRQASEELRGAIDNVIFEDRLLF